MFKQRSLLLIRKLISSSPLYKVKPPSIPSPFHAHVECADVKGFAGHVVCWKFMKSCRSTFAIDLTQSKKNQKFYIFFGVSETCFCPFFKRLAN